jgi:hypothetical protein
LRSAFAKIDRANNHLAQLEEKIKVDEQNKMYGITFRHTESNELVISALIPTELFMQYAIIAGEIIGQARSALEHAVWSLLPNPISGRSGFPVSRSIQHYKDNGLRLIEGINPEAENIIRGLQAVELDYQTNPLYILHELWNRDKHRLLNFCIAYPQGIQIMYVYPNGTFGGGHFSVPPDVNDGTELFRQPHPGLGVQVSAEVAISAVVFNDGLVADQPVTELLQRLVQFSKDTIDKLAATI